MRLNHLQLIGLPAALPRHTANGVKLKLRDLGSPIQQIYTAWIPPTPSIAPGVCVYVEGRLSLEVWPHPTTRDLLATMRIDTTFVNSPPEPRTLNALSLIGCVKYAPHTEQIGGRVVTRLVLEADGQLWMIYAYACAYAQDVQAGDTVFAEGVVSLEDNRSGKGMRYRLRVDAFDVAGPDCPHACDAMRKATRRR